MKSIISFALIALVAAIPAQAADRNYGTVGEFDITGEEGTPTNAGSCFMIKEHEGPGSTILAIMTIQPDDNIESADTSIGLAVTNDNWTSKEDELYEDVSIALNGFEYTGKVLGMRVNGKNGFGRTYDLEILDDIAAAKSIRFYRGEEMFEHLNLEGSSAAIQTFRRCLATRSAEMARARTERDRFKHLKKDPFAK